MQFEEVVADVKGRVETLSKEAQTRAEKVRKQAEGVLNSGVATAKKANGVVVDSAQSVATSNKSLAVELFESAKVSFEKAREAGIKEVAAKPVEFLPAEGKDKVVKGYSDTVATLAKTRDELVKILKAGAKDIQVVVEGKPAKKAPAKRRAPAKKAASTAKKTTTAAKKPAADKTTAAAS